MIISFEGIDGSGKSTQIELLKDYFKLKSIDAIFLREPGGTELSEQIRTILLDNKNVINPISEILLFEAARADLTEKVIIPEHNLGKIVVLDRFYDSTTAYQGFGRGLDLQIVDSMNKFATNNTIPDLSFYLYISYNVSLDRNINKNYDRMESSGEEFFKNIIKGFDQIAINNPKRFHKIDGTLPAMEIHQKIVEIIETKLSVNKNINNLSEKKNG
jgi:dTMP kinase